MIHSVIYYRLSYVSYLQTNIPHLETCFLYPWLICLKKVLWYLLLSLSIAVNCTIGNLLNITGKVTLTNLTQNATLINITNTNSWLDYKIMKANVIFTYRPDQSIPSAFGLRLKRSLVWDIKKKFIRI